MRFFTPDWLEQHDGDNDAFDRYAAHVKTIEDRLLPDLLLLRQQNFLHDGVIRRMRWEAEKREIVMEVDTDAEDDGLREVVLRYLDVQTVEFQDAPQERGFERLGCVTGLGDILYHEIDIMRDTFTHGLLFADGSVLEIAFGDFKLEWTDHPLVNLPQDLDSDDDDLRQCAIIQVSRARDKTYEQRLLHMLSVEPDEGIRRHIVRALGQMHCTSAIPTLLDLLATGQGLIVGDAAEALGHMREPRAREPLEQLKSSQLEWVRNKANWALRQINADSDTPRA